MIKAVDLFCGIGGLTYGLEKAGIDVVLGVDFDQCCKYAYEKNNNAIFLHRDVFELPSKELMRYYKDAKIKILAGCAPCQPFSNHQKNKDRRSNHKDWGLLYEFLRLIKEIEPEIVSVENVPSICKEIVFSDFCIGLKKWAITSRIKQTML